MKMNKKTFVKYLAILFAVFAFFCIGMHYFKGYLNYIEYNEYYNANGVSGITLIDSSQELVQDFEMPYDYLWGIDLKIGTFERHNNSNWQITVVDKETEDVVAKQVFNASFLGNDEFYRIRFNGDQKLKKGNMYELHILSNNVTEGTAILFYTSEIPKEVNTSLDLNGSPTNSSLFLKVYGGDADGWWIGFAVFCFAMILLVVGYCFYMEMKGKPIKSNRLVQAMLVTIMVFGILCTFSGIPSFTDEKDNIRGGMIIAQGGVLYRDYIVQHTPVMYFLCALFANLGAESVQQFRLLYYVVIAVIWGMVYLRHKDNFGGIKMLLLPLMEILFTVGAFYPRGCMILSDNMQGVLMVILLLEFLQYYRDKKIDLPRAIIVSLCIWGNIGVAFVSLYAICAIVIAVLICEIRVISLHILSAKTLAVRYAKLIMICLIPGACMWGYFKANDVEEQAYDMIYRFNTEVYSYFLDGFGKNKLQPFFQSMQSFFAMVVDSVNNIVKGNLENLVIVQVAIVAVVIINLLYQVRAKQFGLAIAAFLAMCFSATRGFEDFHCIPFWAVAIMIAVMLASKNSIYNSRIIILAMGCCAVLLSAGFGMQLMNNFLEEREPVSELEHEIVKQTDEGERILIDTYSLDSIYLLSKNRYPVNSNTYFLPWYMQWYEQEVVEQMNHNQPRIVVFNPEVSGWDYENYTDVFEAALRENYVQYSEIQTGESEGWMKKLWIRN